MHFIPKLRETKSGHPGKLESDCSKNEPISSGNVFSLESVASLTSSDSSPKKLCLSFFSQAPSSEKKVLLLHPSGSEHYQVQDNISSIWVIRRNSRKQRAKEAKEEEERPRRKGSGQRREESRRKDYDDSIFLLSTLTVERPKQEMDSTLKWAVHTY